MKQTRRIDVLKSIVKNKILLLDGAMGTMIQNQNLTEDDYRGEKFKDNDKDLKGNNDILSITQPQLIESIHTCLLYTSPSPRDRTRSRMPSSA